MHYTATHTMLREPIRQGQQWVQQRLQRRGKGAARGTSRGAEPSPRTAVAAVPTPSTPASRARVEADKQLQAAQRRLARAQAEVTRIAELQRQHEQLTAQRVREAVEREQLVEEQRQRVADAERARVAAVERARLERMARTLEEKATRAEAAAASERAQRKALEQKVVAARSQSLEAQGRASAESREAASVQAEAAQRARMLADQVTSEAQVKQAASTAAAAASGADTSAGSLTSTASSGGVQQPPPRMDALSAQASATILSLGPVIETIPRVAPYALGVPLAAAVLFQSAREGRNLWLRNTEAKRLQAERRAQEQAEEDEARRVRLREMVFGPQGTSGSRQPPVRSPPRVVRAAKVLTPQQEATEWIASWRWRRASEAAGVPFKGVDTDVGSDSVGSIDSDDFWADASGPNGDAGSAEDEWNDPEAVKQQVKQLEKFMRASRGV